MNIIHATDFFDPDFGYAYRLLNRQGLLLQEHCHDYYEYFFVISGKLQHVVNGAAETISRGDMFVMRPWDYHGYVMDADVPFELININFTTAELDRLCAYVGDDLKHRLDSSAKPPKIRLDAQQLDHIIKEHEFLNFYAGEQEALQIRMRFLLADALSLFCRKPMGEEGDEVRRWLELTLEKMNTRENIEQGMEAMVRLSGFSHGYLCRLMKEYMNMSPIEYISDIRLVYASNLLRSSDMDVETVSKRVGYSSQSHFIHSFKKKFNITPYKYRKMCAAQNLALEGKSE